MHLTYRPPLDWDALLGFLAVRAVPGLESVEGDRYRRTLRLGDDVAAIVVRPVPGEPALDAEVRTDGAAGPVVDPARRLFDLDTDPVPIAEHLSADPLLAPAVDAHPGLRVPGAAEGFELAVRAVAGRWPVTEAASSGSAGFWDTREGPLTWGHDCPLGAGRARERGRCRRPGRRRRP